MLIAIHLSLEDFDVSFICKWQAAAYIENCNAYLKTPSAYDKPASSLLLKRL